MTAVDAPRVSGGLVAPLRSSAVATWRELPRAAAVGAILLAASAPAVLAGLTGAPSWLLTLSAFPVALLTTGLARVGSAIADGGRASIRDLGRVDAVLALVLLATAVGAAWLVSQDGAPQLVGFVVAGVGLAVLPRALAYGAVRGRSGLGALRGGAILAAYRPGTTLTLLSLGVIGAFAVAATLGTLALVVPVLLATFAARVTSAELESIDAAQGAGR
ncbi:hypothetical protein [Schumannella luteola]